MTVKTGQRHGRLVTHDGGVRRGVGFDPEREREESRGDRIRSYAWDLADPQGNGIPCFVEMAFGKLQFSEGQVDREALAIDMRELTLTLSCRKVSSRGGQPTEADLEVALRQIERDGRQPEDVAGQRLVGEGD